MKIWLRRLGALLVCLLPALLGACGETTGERYTAFACAAFEGDASWTVDGVSYSGHLSLTEGETLSAREATVTYTSPAALAGLTVQAAGGSVTLSLGGVRYTVGETEGAAFLEVFRFFAPVADASVTKRAGEEIFTFSDGEGDYTVRFGADGRVQEMCFASPTHSLRLLPEEKT